MTIGRVGALAVLGLLAPGCRMEQEKPQVAGGVPVAEQPVGDISYAPCGRWIAYAHGGDVWVKLADGEGMPINVTGVVPPEPPAEGETAPAPAAADPVRIAQGPQEGWESDPAWSPDAKSIAFVAARAGVKAEPPDRRRPNVWVIRFHGLRWRVLAEANVRLGPGASDDESAPLFRDVCPEPPAAGETDEQRDARLEKCVRHLIAPATYVQVTDAEGDVGRPIWVPGGREMAVRDGGGRYWTVPLPADLVAMPGEAATGGCGGHAEGAGGGCGCGGHGDDEAGAGASGHAGGGCGCGRHEGGQAGCGGHGDGECGCGRHGGDEAGAETECHRGGGCGCGRHGVVEAGTETEGHGGGGCGCGGKGTGASAAPSGSPATPMHAGCPHAQAAAATSSAASSEPTSMHAGCPHAQAAAATSSAASSEPTSMHAGCPHAQAAAATSSTASSEPISMHAGCPRAQAAAAP
jgi:hypothetical protein